MSSEIAIIGDHFMLPEVFDQKLRTACGDSVTTRLRKDDWPDVPMEHGYAVSGMDGLKEYLGTADDVVEFVGDAQVLVTHLAPMSRGMFERLPNLKMVAVSRGGRRVGTIRWCTGCGCFWLRRAVTARNRAFGFNSQGHRSRAERSRPIAVRQTQ